MSQAKFVMAQPQLSRRRVLRLVAAAAGLRHRGLAVDRAAFPDGIGFGRLVALHHQRNTS